MIKWTTLLRNEWYTLTGIVSNPSKSIKSYNTSRSNIASNDPSLGIDNVNLLSNMFEIYPNPSNEQITIEAEKNNFKNVTVEIINTEGQLIQKFSLQDSKTLINLNKLTGGVYTIKIKTDKGVVVKKLIKQ